MGNVDHYSTFLENLTEAELLAGLIYGEARGECEIGKIAVGCVVMNRCLDSRWGASIRQVALAPYQFSCFNKGDPNRKNISEAINRKDPLYLQCFDIAMNIIDGKYTDPTRGATHYHTTACSPKWIKSPKMKFIKRIGRHLFYHEYRS